MGKSIQQLVREHEVKLKETEKIVIDLRKRVEELELKYAQPVKDGRRLPPTARPETLKDMEIGRDPA